MIPKGLWFLLFRAGWLGEAGDCSLSLPALVVAMFLTKFAGSYYDTRFGKVITFSGQEARQFMSSIDGAN